MDVLCMRMSTCLWSRCTVPSVLLSRRKLESCWTWRELSEDKTIRKFYHSRFFLISTGQTLELNGRQDLTWKENGRIYCCVKQAWPLSTFFPPIKSPPTVTNEQNCVVYEKSSPCRKSLYKSIYIIYTNKMKYSRNWFSIIPFLHLISSFKIRNGGCILN